MLHSGGLAVIQTPVAGEGMAKRETGGEVASGLWLASGWPRVWPVGLFGLPGLNHFRAANDDPQACLPKKPGDRSHD